MGQLLANVSVGHPVHDVAWDPFAENEFVTAGEAQLTFWLLHQTSDGTGYSLKNQVAKIPEALFGDNTLKNNGDLLGAEGSEPILRFNTVFYKPPPSSLVFTSTLKGVVSVWDSRDNSCLFSFTADPDEICKSPPSH